ncbi:hypothetical protein FOA52_007260 [Chlamydomonas sp. UWO 241]|nr:hypothetical protein FOA52_007260 [Chlamydomonas sp. UWO 241]
MVRTWRCPGPSTPGGPPGSAPPGVSGAWVQGEVLQGHSDWVRDVAWAPNPGLPRSTIASGGQDGAVYAWSEQAAGGVAGGADVAAAGAGPAAAVGGGPPPPAIAWDRRLVHDFRPAAVWRVAWSTCGGVLAVTDGAAGVTLWREAVDGVWQQISQ